jgi:DNA mismatch endonuclease, patch repair protein
LFRRSTYLYEKFATSLGEFKSENLVNSVPKSGTWGGSRPKRPIRIACRWNVDERLRAVAHANGLRYRRSVKDLPGVPHVVFPRFRTVVFCCACCDYQHKPDCPLWTAGFKGWGNYPGEPYFVAGAKVRRRELDIVTEVLQRRGWKVLTLWECQVVDDDYVKDLVSGIGSFEHVPEPRI